MKYKYSFFDGELLPIVPIILKGKVEEVELKAYIDTGASYCLFHADIAEIIGIKLEEGDLTEMVLGDGNIIRIYLHKVPVSIGEHKFTALVGFSKGLGIKFNIIGRKGIFDKFVISFNEKDKEIEFVPHEKMN
ncbi:retropepsin-like domain-containing protein [Candidatus Woesearchaeota archaeon]|nr:retropepsin-like domain-containing protein [Candidatus Woesearchaeota archaeon]